MRVVAILLIAFGTTIGCQGQDACIRVGENLLFGTADFEKVSLLSDHVRNLGLPTTPDEAALIVGAAYAFSQIEGGQARSVIREVL